MSIDLDAFRRAKSALADMEPDHVNRVRAYEEAPDGPEKLAALGKLMQWEEDHLSTMRDLQFALYGAEAKITLIMKESSYFSPEILAA